MRQTGIVNVLEYIVSAWCPKLTVFTYHRIAEPSINPFYDPVISATRESFGAQMEWLCSHYRIITIDELVSQLESGLACREPHVLLTFDDGYKDNFEIAAPILRRLGIPATFFIPTAFLDTPRLPWWDHIAYVIKQTTKPQLSLKVSPQNTAAPLEIDLSSTTRTAAVQVIVRAFLDETITDETWFLDQLSARAEVTVDPEHLGRELFMSWEQIEELASAGLTIGSHSHTHHNLARLDEASQCYELTESKRRLERRLRCEVCAVAYPYGWRGTHNERTRSNALNAGYRLAFTSQTGVNQYRKLDPFQVSRLAVGAADSIVVLRARTALHGAFSRSSL
jgi:peptidoglycan/xylan/chitin deacetylase (PgdA/CDA1 family)